MASAEGSDSSTPTTIVPATALALVERVDAVREAFGDDGALDLHRRGQLLLGLAEVALEHREALDLLDPREAPVGPVDVAAQDRVHALVVRHRRQVERDAELLG